MGDVQTIPRRQRILIAGATGLIGSALVEQLRERGHGVRRLVRRPPAGADEFCWNPEKGEIDAGALAGVTAVINLAGANVDGGRWTEKRKRLILTSRVNATRTLVVAMEKATVRPAALINASAAGWYGDTGDRVADEKAPRGNGFLAEVCTAWESEASRAAESGVRTTLLRLGVVLSPAGGALAKLLPVFRCGLGGRLGDGRQWMSWIAMEDLLAVIERSLEDSTLAGPINAVAPGAVTNGEFTRILAQVLRRPAVLPAPAWVLRALFGEMAKETVLASARVAPLRLLESGFGFARPGIESALRHSLAKRA